MKGGNRIVAFDYLRILAAYTVIVLHVVSNPFVSTFPSFEWNVANFYESLVRWNVPIFVMISGALFLNRKLDNYKLWTKNILRILIVFIFWSAIYEIPLVGNAHNIYSIIAGIAHGPSHFWYLKMLLGLYIAIPVYKYIVTNKDVEGYFLILTFIVGILIPSCLSVVSLVNVSAKEFLQELLNSVSGNMVSTYSFYFVLGHYLTNYKMNRNIVIYILGIISCLSCFLFTYSSSNMMGKPIELFFQNSCILTMFECIAIYVLFQRFEKFKSNVFVDKLSGSTFGIYIVHLLVLEILYGLGFERVSNVLPILFFPLFSLLVFVVSFVIVVFLRRVPIVNKWLL